MQNNIGLFLTKRAHLNPNLEALVEVERRRRFTYAELNARTNRIAAVLLSEGVRIGDRVALLLRTGVEFAETYFALAKIGALLVPLNWRLVPDELEFMLRDSGTSVLVFDGEFDVTATALHERETPVQKWIRTGDGSSCLEFAESYDALTGGASSGEPHIGAADDDPLLIVYTSGTTGFPKGATHTHSTMAWACLTWILSIDFRRYDRMLLFTPPFHVGVILPLTLLIHLGGTNVVMRSFDLTRIFPAIEQERITATFAVPTMLQRMLDYPERQKYDCNSLRWILVGAGVVPRVLIDRFSTIGTVILQDYGLTESLGPATIITPEEVEKKPDSAGKACFYTDVRIVDEQGQDVGPNCIGEVVIRAPHVMKGYWNRPDATAEAIRDGWLCTGDLAVMDEDGCLYIRDRKKDMIISGGENIYPIEIENVLLTHPSVKEAAVIGMPSAQWGESPAAIIVVGEGKKLNTEEVIAYCRGKIAGYKIPRAVEFVQEIPRSATGKVQKHVLRKSFPGPAPQ